MGRKTTAGSQALRRGMVAVTVAGATIVMLVAFAMAFSNATAAQTIAESSQELQWANAAAGASAVTRAALNQALVFTVDHELEVASAQAAQEARQEAGRALTGLQDYVDTAPKAAGPEVGEIEQVIAAGWNALAAMEGGEIRTADETLGSQFEPAYVRAAAALNERQQVQAARIDSATSSAGKAETITRLIVTLLIPGAAIIIHQLIIRRQYRERQVHMEAQIEAERELNRSKDDFIAGVSHELRTPLTSILGFSEYLLEFGFIDPTESLELISMINEDSAELSRMVDDLLAAARIDADALSYNIMPLELKGEVEHLVDQFRRAGSKIEVLGARTVGLADRSRLRQILRNLISNAERYGDSHIEVDIAVTKGRAVIRVIDDGPGVKPEMADRLFTRFMHDGEVTLTSGSVGLGLAIARQMARDMGGDITYQRTLGMTLFSVILPLAAPTALPTPHTDVPDAEIYADSALPGQRSGSREPVPAAVSVDDGREAGREMVVVFE